MDTSSAPALPRNGRVVADYEQRGYHRVRETGVGVVLRHPNGGMITVLANGETRGGDKAGRSENLSTPDEWWGEPTYTAPQ
jgi:predicted RNA binding protein YcfA (HicA-like mRNA interferase family)